MAYGQPVAINWAASYFERADERPFSVTWRGWLLIERSGPYSFSLVADDAAWLWIDGRRVIEAVGDSGEARGSLPLPSGLHEFRLEYVQNGGAATLYIGWAAGRDVFRPLESGVLFPNRLAYYIQAYLPVGVLLSFCWSALIVALPAIFLLRSVAREVRAHPESRVGTSLWALLGTALVLAVVPLWWGLPRGWEADELRPADAINALEMWFSGGWHDHYPPLYFYVLGVLSVPFAIAAHLGVVDLWAPAAQTSLLVIYRLSAALAMVTLVYLTYVLGRDVFGTRAAGLWSAFFMLSAPNIVFHGKLAKPDLPYVALYAVSLVFYVRAVRHNRGSDYLKFAVAATLAVCTKDQAYGLFALPALHLMWRRFQVLEGRTPRRVSALARDRVIWRALVVAAAVFAVAHNLLFNFSGFVQHVALITGGGSAPFRMYERSLAGHAAMFGDALLQLPWNLGWPGAVVVVAGLVHLFLRDRAAWLTLVLPVVSYYVCFIGVVMYQYDRFWLPALVSAVVPAGGVVAAFLSVSTGARWRRFLIGVVGAYTFAYGASVNVLMLRDSRYSAERWLKAHASDDQVVAFVGPTAYLPRPQTFRSEFIDPDPAVLALLEPDLVVINSDYMKRFAGQDTEAAAFMHQLTASSHAPYRPVAQFKSGPGVAVLAYQRVFSNGREDPFTNLDKINPVIQVFARMPVGPSAPND